MTIKLYTLNPEEACGNRRPSFIAPIGSRYSRLVVIGYTKIKQGDRFRFAYFTQCDCGNKKAVHHSYMLRGQIKSCGCFRKEYAHSRNKTHNFGKIRKLPGEVGLRSLICRYKIRAKNLQLEFSLSDDDFRNLCKKSCYYCGSSPNQIIGKQKSNTKNRSKISIENSLFKYNGLDRLDSKKGYIIDNVVPCCKTCNMAKSSMSVDQFLEWLVKVTSHLKLMKAINNGTN